MFERIIPPLAITILCLLMGWKGFVFALINWIIFIKETEKDVVNYTDKDEAESVVIMMKVVAFVVLAIFVIIGLSID